MVKILEKDTFCVQNKYYKHDNNCLNLSLNIPQQFLR